MKFCVECSRRSLWIEAGSLVHLWALMEARSSSRWDLWREDASLCIKAGRLAVDITLPWRLRQDRDGVTPRALVQ